MIIVPKSHPDSVLQVLQVSTIGGIISGFFSGGGPKLGGVLVPLPRNEGKIWCKAPCCCFLVDGPVIS